MIVQSIDSKLMAVGKQPIEDFIIPAGSKIIRMEMPCDWPTIDNGTQATVTLETSEDDGKTWRHRLTIVYTGGLNPRTKLPATGPSPYYEVQEPIEKDLIGRWSVEIVEPLTAALKLSVD